MAAGGRCAPELTHLFHACSVYAPWGKKGQRNPVFMLGKLLALRGTPTQSAKGDRRGVYRCQGHTDGEGTRALWHRDDGRAEHGHRGMKTHSGKVGKAGVRCSVGSHLLALWVSALASHLNHGEWKIQKPSALHADVGGGDWDVFLCRNLANHTSKICVLDCLKTHLKKHWNINPRPNFRPIKFRI